MTFDLNDELVRHQRWAEAVRPFPYEDQVGKLTIGVGRNLDDNGLSDDEINYLHQNDLNRCWDEAATLGWFADLDDVRKLVVLDMIFNLGLKRFRGFVNTIAALEVKDFKTAAREMVDSKWYRQTGRRAKRLVRAMATGEWQ